jgi:hypothetical protein
VKSLHYVSSFLLIAGTAAAQVQSVPVTADNFIRAESDLYFGNAQKDAGGTGKFFHHREPTQIEKQPVIRMNRDTLYSGAIFDLDAGPVTVTLPNAGKRFMSMQVINEDQYTPMVVYRPGNVTLTRDKIGTRYVMTAIRTLVDPNDAKDVQQVHALQDAKGWNYIVRLYRPRTEILSGKWKFPEAQAAN